MGSLIPFPNRPECPPHDWVPIYDEVRDGLMLDEGEEEYLITGRVCVKCSLIESGESLALMWNVKRGVPSGSSGGQGQGFFNGIIKPLFCEVEWARLLLVHLWYFEIAAWASWFERAANTGRKLLLRRQS
jgi:hypothetical protein